MRQSVRCAVRATHQPGRLLLAVLRAASRSGQQVSPRKIPPLRLVAILAPLVLAIALAGLFIARSVGPREARPIPLSELAQRVHTGNIVEIRMFDRGGEASTRCGEVV